MGKFRQFSKELSARDTSVFSFPDDNLSECQWICTKLVMCIEIVEIWFGIGNCKISSILTQLSARAMTVVGYYRFLFLFFI